MSVELIEDDEEVLPLLMDKVQCLRDIIGYMSDQIIEINSSYEGCCVPASSSSSSSSSTSSSSSSSSSSEEDEEVCISCSEINDVVFEEPCPVDTNGGPISMTKVPLSSVNSSIKSAYGGDSNLQSDCAYRGINELADDGFIYLIMIKAGMFSTNLWMVVSRVSSQNKQIAQSPNTDNLTNMGCLGIFLPIGTYRIMNSTGSTSTPVECRGTISLP